MTAGADDADGAHGSLHALRAEDTEDVMQRSRFLHQTYTSFVLPSNHVALWAPGSLLGQRLPGVPGKTSGLNQY